MTQLVTGAGKRRPCCGRHGAGSSTRSEPPDPEEAEVREAGPGARLGAAEAGRNPVQSMLPAHLRLSSLPHTSSRFSPGGGTRGGGGYWRARLGLQSASSSFSELARRGHPLRHHLPDLEASGARVRPVKNTCSPSRLCVFVSRCPCEAGRAERWGSALGDRERKQLDCTVSRSSPVSPVGTPARFQIPEAIRAPAGSRLPGLSSGGRGPCRPHSTANMWQVSQHPALPDSALTQHPHPSPPDREDDLRIRTCRAPGSHDRSGRIRCQDGPVLRSGAPGQT